MGEREWGWVGMKMNRELGLRAGALHQCASGAPGESGTRVKATWLLSSAHARLVRVQRDWKYVG